LGLLHKNDINFCAFCWLWKGAMNKIIIVDCLQYSKWTRKIFQQMNDGGVHAVHVTISYHETFREMVHNLEQWNRWFEEYSELIFLGKTSNDILRARKENKTAIFFGFQNPSPIEEDLGLIEICYSLGIRFMQLSYNNQSLFASGCYEKNDRGITRFGQQLISEMNRLGIVIDMSHSGEQSTLEAIEISTKPIAITHANPSWWHSALRNKSDTVLKKLANSKGMLGFSLYPHHLHKGSDCSINSFCRMIVEAASRYGIDCLGIGSDLCQDQDDSIVEWMRNGRWTKVIDFGEGSVDGPGFPDQPKWFCDNRDFENIKKGLISAGFTEVDVAAVMGGNWLRFFEESFGQ